MNINTQTDFPKAPGCVSGLSGGRGLKDPTTFSLPVQGPVQDTPRLPFWEQIGTPEFHWVRRPRQGPQTCLSPRGSRQPRSSPDGVGVHGAAPMGWCLAVAVHPLCSPLTARLTTSGRTAASLN